MRMDVDERRSMTEFKASLNEWFWSRFWAMVFDFVASKTVSAQVFDLVFATT